MEIRDRGSKQIEGGGHTMTRKFFSGLVLAIALLVAGGGVLHGQKVPDPQPAPQVAPHPSRTEVRRSRPSRQSRPNRRIHRKSLS